MGGVHVSRRGGPGGRQTPEPGIHPFRARARDPAAKGRRARERARARVVRSGMELQVVINEAESSLLPIGEDSGIPQEF